MAVASYTEDLTDIDLAETASLGSYEALGGGGAGLAADVDFAIQGNESITKQVTNSRKGIVFDNAAGITIPAGDHVFVWVYCTTPGLLNTLAVGGLCVTIGDALANRNEFHIAGATEYAAGGWRCIPVSYVTTANTGSHPYRTNVGTPTGDPQFFGVIVHTTDTVMAVNTSVDAMRYGTGAFLTAGELISAGDASDIPCTFGGFATQNDSNTNKWGILAEVDGGYALQGKFVIGQTNAGTPTLARFKDSNTQIIIVDTFHAAADFTQIIIDHASTRVEWDNVSILALGTINPGQFVANNASSTVIINGGTFTDIGISTLRAGVTATGLTWRTCDQVTQNGATITACIVDGTTSTAAILSDNPSVLTDTDFPGGGTGHAVRCDTVGTYNWNGNSDTGYTGTRGSNAVSSSGSTDAMFYNNSGGLITLNVGGGGQSPSVRNGAGATTTVNATVNVTFELIVANTEVRVFETGTETEIDGIEDVSTVSLLDGTKYKFTWSSSNGTVVDYQLINNGYVIFRVEGYTVPSADVEISIAQRVDLNS